MTPRKEIQELSLVPIWVPTRVVHPCLVFADSVLVCMPDTAAVALRGDWGDTNVRLSVGHS